MVVKVEHLRLNPCSKMEGWRELKAPVRIAYSNQNHNDEEMFSISESTSNWRSAKYAKTFTSHFQIADDYQIQIYLISKRIREAVDIVNSIEMILKM